MVKYKALWILLREQPGHPESDAIYGAVDILHDGLLLTIIYVRLPCLSDVLRTDLRKKRCLAVILEGRPVTADSSFIGYDGLEDTAVVVGVMPVLRREHNVSGLIANEVFVVGRNQQKLTFAEAACAAIVGQIENSALPLLNVDGVAQECNPLATVADVQA